MSLKQAAERYAKTLLDLSFEQKIEEGVRQDMDFVGATLEHEQLRQSLMSPIVEAATKKSVLKKLFEHEVHELSLKFLYLLIDKGREELITEAVGSFVQQYNERNGIQPVDLTTAADLDKSAFKELTDKISKDYFQGKQLEIRQHVDESLVGGFILEFNNQRIDTSVKGKLAKLLKSYSNQ